MTERDQSWEQTSVQDEGDIKTEDRGNREELLSKRERQREREDATFSNSAKEG